MPDLPENHMPSAALILRAIRALRWINTDESNAIADELDATLIAAADYAMDAIARYQVR